jgi:3-isopropylmalate/(R)-2-methylmalate dehydratase small subunit
MKKFRNLTSVCCPLPFKDIDTDMIIPAQFMTSTSKEGYGQNLFRRLRDANPDFPINQSKYKNSKIMIADDNFGCGSSREHAVWALMSWGIEVIIAKSFADIFASNSAKSGLLLITLPALQVDDYLNRASSESALILTIDLERQIITESDGSLRNFQYNPFRKHCILNGLDDLDYMLSKLGEIREFKSKQEISKP